MNTQRDSIEKIVDLDASPSAVWKAVSDHREFGQWFRVALDQPFVEGAESTGKVTYPGYEGLPWLAHVERIEPERYLAFRWHDYDPDADRPVEEFPTTLVEFLIEPRDGGTRLTIRESGFAAFGEARGIEAMRRNAGGWDIQAGHIREHVAGR